jgi:hypothetical protein
MRGAGALSTHMNMEATMKLNVLTLALAVTLAGTFAASAQVVIEDHTAPPPVVVEHPDTSVTVHEDHGLLGSKRTTVETTGSGDCTTKTVHKEDITGSKTVRKSNCD